MTRSPGSTLIMDTGDPDDRYMLVGRAAGVAETLGFGRLTCDPDGILVVDQVELFRVSKPREALC